MRIAAKPRRAKNNVRIVPHAGGPQTEGAYPWNVKRGPTRSPQSGRTGQGFGRSASGRLERRNALAIVGAGAAGTAAQSAREARYLRPSVGRKLWYSDSGNFPSG